MAPDVVSESFCIKGVRRLAPDATLGDGFARVEGVRADPGIGAEIACSRISMPWFGDAWFGGSWLGAAWSLVKPKPE